MRSSASLSVFDCIASLSHDGAHRLAIYDLHQVAANADVEHDETQAVVAAQRDRGRIHDLEIPVQDIHVADAGEEHRGGVLLGVPGVDAVHLGAFEHDVRPDLDRAQHGGGVG